MSTLTAAADLLMAEGFAALTMERVAERAGVSKGLGYVYFDNAEDLALALYDREVTRVYERTERVMRAPGTFADRLRRAFRAYLDVVAERGVLFAVLQSNLVTRRLEKAARRRVAAFLEFWTDAVVRESGLDRTLAAMVAWMVLHAADAGARAWRARRLPRADVELVCVRFVLAGLRGVATTPRKRRKPAMRAKRPSTSGGRFTEGRTTEES